MSVLNPDITDTHVPAQDSPKVALACPGIGLVQRGYERFFLDIYEAVREDIDITIFKGGGEQNEHERVVPFADRNGIIPKLFPVHKIFSS